MRRHAGDGRNNKHAFGWNAPPCVRSLTLDVEPFGYLPHPLGPLTQPLHRRVESCRSPHGNQSLPS